MISTADLEREFKKLHKVYDDHVIQNGTFKPPRIEDSDDQAAEYLQYIKDSPNVEIAAFRYVAFCRPNQVVETNGGGSRTFEHAGAGFNIIYGHSIEDPISYFEDFPVPVRKQDRKKLLSKCFSKTSYYPLSELVAFRTPSEEEDYHASETPKPAAVRSSASSDSASASPVPPKLTKSFADIIAKPEAKRAERPLPHPSVQLPKTRSFITARMFQPIVLQQFEAINALYFSGVESQQTSIEQILDNNLVYRLANPLCEEIELLGTKGIVAICGWLVASDDLDAKIFITKSLVAKIQKIEPIIPVATFGKIEGYGTTIQAAIHALQALLTTVKDHTQRAAILATMTKEQAQELHAITALVRELCPE